jgi:hypothetical protein
MSEQEPGNNADETLLRKDTKRGSDVDNASENNQSAHGDETVIRGSDTDASAGAHNETAIREDTTTKGNLEENQQVASSDDATIILGAEEDSPAPDDTTLIRNKVQGSGSGDAAMIRGADESQMGNDDATIIRGAEQLETDDATIIRGTQDAVSNDSATILREPGSEDGQATILRSGSQSRDIPADAATILRHGPVDDDATVINNPDDDATVIGGGGDTTLFAAAGPAPAQASRANSEAGRLLKNRFVLEEKVGSGGMGDVYKALDLRQQEAQERNPYIAIKILNESFARHKDAFISLQRETTRTRGIPHPNIMAVYDFDKEGDTVFMSMELLDGKPHDDHI